MTTEVKQVSTSFSTLGSQAHVGSPGIHTGTPEMSSNYEKTNYYSFKGYI